VSTPLNGLDTAADDSALADLADEMDTVPSREAIVRTLADAISEAHRKVENGRVRNAENEQVRQDWIRTLAYAAN